MTNFKSVASEGKKLNFYPISLLSALIVAIIIGSGIYRDVYQQFIGINIVYIGILFAISRVVASIVSHHAYKIYKKLKAKVFFALLLIFDATIIILIGVINNKWFAAPAFILLAGGMWGIGPAINHYKLDYIKKSNFKATLLSFGGLFANLFVAIMSFTAAFLMDKFSYAKGYIYYGILSAILFLISYFIFKIYEEKPK